MRVHLDEEIYVVSVLWLTGRSASAIAKLTGKTRNQVLNIIANREYRNRTAMSLEDRQRALDELKAKREDMPPPRLSDRFFVARPLKASQARPGKR